MNMYFGLIILMVHIANCFCYVGYQMFQGFDYTPITTVVPNYSTIMHDPEQKESTLIDRQLNPPNSSFRADNFTYPNTTKKTEVTNGTNITTETTKFQYTTISTTTPLTLLPVKAPKFNCSEDEKPFNIGTYEVPTQRDVVLLIRKTLLRSFNNYQQKALYFLKDIQEATQSTSAIAHKCGNPVDYKRCVKRVSVKCQVITKSLVTALERQRVDVAAFIEGTICKVKEMNADPVQLLKTLAMEEASLEFALPGFLRLLGACSVYCDNYQSKNKSNRQKPLRHMTDQDLVVKHFLTKKNYIQLLKGSK